MVIFEKVTLGWSAFPKTIRTRNLCFAYKKKTRKKWKYNHLKSKSQLYFRNELLPSSGLVGCVGYCWSLVRGPVDLWSVSSRVDWPPVAPVQRPDNWPAPAPCPQCPHSAAHLPNTPPPPLDTAPPHQAKCHSARWWPLPTIKNLWRHSKSKIYMQILNY